MNVPTKLKLDCIFFRYYVGRKYMFDYDFKEAEEYLRYKQ